MSVWSKNVPAKTNNLFNLQKEMNEFFDVVTRDPFLESHPAMNFSPKLEIKEDDKAYHICAEVPGMREEDIRVTLKENKLVLEGERKSEKSKEEKGITRSEFSYGSFYRAIPFTSEVNAEKVSATYKDGLLHIDVEKAALDTARSRKINIKRA